jgi:hypothetical protein
MQIGEARDALDHRASWFFRDDFSLGRGAARRNEERGKNHVSCKQRTPTLGHGDSTMMS